MYITGTVSDFESRLHQLAISGADLTTFLTECRGYTGTGAPSSGAPASGLTDRWNREFAIKLYQISGLSNYYLTGAI